MTLMKGKTSRPAPALDEAKFGELIVYVAHRAQDDPRLGAVKLERLLYYVDFYAYRVLAEPITGAEYQRLPDGPAPRDLPRIRDALVGDGSVRLENRVGFNHVLQRMVPLREPDMSHFSREETRLVDEVIEALWHYNEWEVSDMSRREAGWRLTADYETIAYRTAWLSSQALTQDQIERGRQLARQGPVVG